MSSSINAPEIAVAVNGDRLLSRLDALAQIGRTDAGGVERVAFSALEVEANDLVIGWLRELDLTIARDEFGNLFASTDGNDPAGKPWMAGSHIDTVPDGGRLDGALGVVAAVEAVAALRSCGAVPACGLEVVIWRCEEPVRFARGKVGSLLFSGVLSPDDLSPLVPDVDLQLAPATGPLPLRPSSRRVGGCLELHIEQGRRLERSGHRLGVVTAVASPIRLQLTVTGRADHSGATPMNDRHDALCAAAEIVLAIEGFAIEETEHETVATAAQAEVSPGTMNVVPGNVVVLVDVRGIDGPSMRRLVQHVAQAAEQIAAKRGVTVESKTLSSAEPTLFDEAVIAAIAEVSVGLGEEPLIMPSGGGHDCQCIAPLAPAGMLFVPSIDGISHSPLERTDDADLVLGTQALAIAWGLLSARDGL